MSARCNEEQREMLVTYMEENPVLVTNKFTPTYTAKIAQKLWEEAAQRLNSVPGSNKDWVGWKETWKRIKRTTKEIKGKINVSARGTGGGPPSKKFLTPCQDRIVALIGQTAIEGHKHRESAIRGGPKAPTAASTLNSSPPDSDEDRADDPPPINDDWQYLDLDLCGQERSYTPAPAPAPAPGRTLAPTPTPTLAPVPPPTPAPTPAPTPGPGPGPRKNLGVGRQKMRAAEARLLRASAAAAKFQTVQEEMLELRKSELEIIIEQNTIANNHAAKLLAFQIAKQQALERQNLESNRLAAEQIAVQQRLVDVLEKLAKK